ncbi:MAG: hypothetical protein Q9227_000885 [Pyrenula ochraceoflavens]
MSKAIGSLPVARALDFLKPAEGKIYLPDPENDPTLLRGVGTDFTSKQFMAGGLVVLPQVKKQTPSTEIGQIVGPEELRLKKPFKTPEAISLLTGKGELHMDGEPANGSADREHRFEGTTFKVAPHVDQSQIYDVVFEVLKQEGCIGIFPEGGSHDRPDLLPLKAGVAIMALGALAADPDCGVQIIPCGMNYFHPHKFRSRAVIEFGHPIEAHPDQVEAYKNGDRRGAVGSLLETVYQGLVAVTQTAPDYETLMLVQAARRLYNPTGKKLPLPLVVELNRRLVKGYTQYKDDPRIVNLRQSVLQYNAELRKLGVRDHQVEWGNVKKRPWVMVLGILLYRVAKLVVLAIGTLPGLAMFWPIFVATKVISRTKSKEALSKSTVKLAGRDVISTWKLLVALALAPALYAYYTIILTTWTYYNRTGGYYTYRFPWWTRATTYIPDWVPLWAVAILSFIVCTSVTFAALRIGEIGMDIVKSLQPLIVALSPQSSNRLAQLVQRRVQLSKEVTEIINTLGPEVFPDFDAERIVADPFREGAYQSRLKTDDGSIAEPKTPVEVEPEAVSGASEPPTPTTPEHGSHGRLPRNESFKNIGAFGFFATRPPSRSRSRSSSDGAELGMAPIKRMSTLTDKGGVDEVTKRIRGAMKERGKQRRRGMSEQESREESEDEVEEGKKMR